MAKKIDTTTQGGLAAGALIAGAVCLLALPSAVLAFSSRFEPKLADVAAQDAASSAASTQQRVAAHLAPSIPVRSLGKGLMFHFTPAGIDNRPDRSVTVAVRVDPRAAPGIAGNWANPAIAATLPAVAPLQIAPTAFNLGVSRGYNNFAQNLVTPAEIRKIDMPDLSSFKAAPGANGDTSRFSPHIVMDERQAPGRAPRTFADKQESVDLGGAYRVARNLDVTAGVRYSQEHDRLRPLTDGKKDSQAVYVGTQFRF